jgi:hypothetical protein
VDKARFTGMSVLSYFNLAPKEISVAEAAEKLVKDLVGENHASDSNSSAHHAPTAETSERALAALQLLHGSQDGLPPMMETIRSAKKEYLLQSREKNSEKAAVDFDQKVEKLLVAKLTGRMRLFYRGKVQELDQSFANGQVTKSQYSQELNLYLDEVKQPKNCSLQMEVMNVLKVVGGKEPNVVNALRFLFKAELRSEQQNRLALFDTVLNEIIENKFDSSNNAPVEATKFRRAFIAEARRQLGSRLSEGFSTEYSAMEKTQRVEMENRKISYDDYVKSMRDWIDERNLQRQVGPVLGNLNDRDNVIALLSFVNFKKNNVLIKFGNPYNKNPDLKMQCGRFESDALRYSQYHSLGGHDEDKEYTRFLTEAERRLVSALPEDIKKAMNDRKKGIEILVANQYISEDEVKKNQIIYFSSLVSGENNKESLISDIKSSNSDELKAKKAAMEKLIEDGLSKSIRKNNREKDVLEALIMCWGGFVNNHRSEFSLYPLCNAKNAYLSIGKSHPSHATLVQFYFDNDFSVEARARLVEFLPDEVRVLYQEREKILSDYYKKNMIDAETFKNSMGRFLKHYFD